MKILRTILVAVVFAFAALPASAQSPQSNPGWTFGYVPTAAEWNFWFGKKVDFAGALPCIVTGCSFTGSVTITTANANALAVGPNGVTSPTFNVDSSVASAVTGLNVQGKAAGNGVTLAALSSAANESMNINSKGTGGTLFAVGGGMAIDGTTPTSCASTGSGTGPSCALEAGSNNSVGRIQITSGTTPGSSGTFTITFANAIVGANNPVCTFTYNDTGTAWNAGALPMHLTSTSTSVVTGTWNNTAALTASVVYKIDYHCFGK